VRVGVVAVPVVGGLMPGLTARSDLFFRCHQHACCLFGPLAFLSVIMVHRRTCNALCAPVSFGGTIGGLVLDGTWRASALAGTERVAQ